ncbi:MAG: hypothetical protein ACK4M9_21990 [Anaerobacillus sp.]|uniref:hypothetical protein n=1 Tax=Anaerobacillus sp. TaxID=1872506 RepID=UPI00391C96DB
MVQIIYSGKITDFKGRQLSINFQKQFFKEAINILSKLVSKNKRVAYFFIDPLLNGFEAANHFYFGVFECESIDKINCYKSGASPIQALADAKELIDNGLYDVVFLFGYEPLLTNKKVYGKEAVTKAMNIFDKHSLIQCYNELAHRLCQELVLSEKNFKDLCDQLFMNYYNTYKHVSGKEVKLNRGRQLDDQHADLFKLTDCANPNIDFAGGMILTNENTAEYLQVPHKEQIKVTGVKYVSVKGSPDHIDKIVGHTGNVFPHLKAAFLQAEAQSKINVVEQYKQRNLFLEVYTCYPPVPIAFLLATGIIDTIDQLPHLLEEHEITITGGMNFARAPWNNPALNGLIEMHQKLKAGPATYGLVHGNGGIGEIQGVAILERGCQAPY